MWRWAADVFGPLKNGWNEAGARAVAPTDSGYNDTDEDNAVDVEAAAMEVIDAMGDIYPVIAYKSYIVAVRSGDVTFASQHFLYLTYQSYAKDSANSNLYSCSQFHGFGG